MVPGNGASTDYDTPNLPEEIVFDILKRLPVKTLLKFKCVSKSWLSLISSPLFVKSHLQVAEKDSSLAHHRVMLNNWKPFFRHVSVRSLMMEEASIYPIHAPHPANEDWRCHFVRMVGTHNGLVCIVIDQTDVFLWNPTTRASTLLPHFDPGMFIEFFFMAGFGYCNATQEYKVCLIYSLRGTVDVHMYSQKANSWKKIEGWKIGPPWKLRVEGWKNMVPVQSGKLVNDKLHFAASRSFGSEDRCEIVSVDLDSETYGVIKQPDYDGDGTFLVSIGVLRDCLCVLRSGYDNVVEQHTGHVDLWVMKEYGVKDSWTNLVRTRFMDDIGEDGYLHSLIMLPNGKILFMCGNQLAIYDPKDNIWAYPEVRDLQLLADLDLYADFVDSPELIRDFMSLVDADVYVESLVSPQLNAN